MQIDGKNYLKNIEKNLSPQKNKSVVANEETIEVCIDIENKISKCYISKNDHQDWFSSSILKLLSKHSIYLYIPKYGYILYV